MPCNAWNHGPNCNCGWGGQWHGPSAQGTFAGTSRSRLWNYSPTFYNAFVYPNAICQSCNKRVFYYQNSYGSKVFFDDIGPPWPKHLCKSYDQYKKTIFLNPSLAFDNDFKKPLEKQGWSVLEVQIANDSQNNYIFFNKYGIKLITNVSFKKINILSDFVWIRPDRKENKVCLFSFVDNSSCEPIAMRIQGGGFKVGSDGKIWRPLSRIVEAGEHG